MEALMNPIIQGGFAGMCAILLGILFWVIRKLLDVLKSNTDAFNANTAAINTLNVNMSEQRIQVTKLTDELYQRPCLIEEGKRT
jgi:hypothetical protein